MRNLLWIFTLVFAVSVSAQSPAAKQYFNAGTQYARGGEFEKARAIYLVALASAEATDKNFLARLHYNLGVCEYRLGHSTQAADELRMAIVLRGGEYAEANYALGMAESENQNWPKAREAFLASLKTNEKNGEAWFDLAFAYLGERDYTRAEAAFRNAIAYKTIDTPLSHNNLGVILAMRGDINGAKAEFKNAVRTSGGRLKIAENNLIFFETQVESAGISKNKLTVAERQKD